MKYFPLFADLDKAHVLVVGGGEQAAQKVRLLRKTERAHHGRRRDRHRRAARARGRATRIWIVLRAFLARDLEGQRLVYAATGDRALDAAVSRAAKARGIPVNVVDAPELSTFIMPAIVDRAPVTVAIGTEGAAPVLAREIKTRLETWLPANFGALAERAQALRARRRQDRSRCPLPPPSLGAAAARSLPPRRPERRGGRGRPHPRRRAPWRGSPAAGLRWAAWR